MASTTRSISPHTEPFPPLEAAPTPTLLPTSGFENDSKLRPPAQQKVLADASPRPHKAGYPPSNSSVPLTGAAAMADLKRRKQQKAAEDARQTSPNPAAQAMQSLMGSGGMSKPSDAPAPNKLAEPLQRVAEKIRIPERPNISGDSMHASPVSMTSFGTNEGTNATSALTATAIDHPPPTSVMNFVAEPAQMTESGSYAGHLTVASEDGSKAFSYPGPALPDHNSDGGRSRGTSYPDAQGSPKSSASNRRYKCPYCSTDFTRHHNLKSHLLTHSQEKPYVCQTCQLRFRRLHDLKRHTKLHTGERPHTCDKCGRRFARGDALARHNKGPGGCAGRRSSFAGDDELSGDGAGGEGMDDIKYTGGEEDEEGGAGSQPRRVSEPSRKRAHVESPHDSSRDVYRQHSSTYPPVGPAPGRPHGSSVSSMGPPQVVHPGSSTATSPRDLSGQTNPAIGGGSSYPSYPPPHQVFGSQGGVMIESPKPLSPGQPTDQHRLSVDAAMGGHNRNRSPSLTTQFQQTHFGRGGGRGTPPYPPSTTVPPPQAPHAAPVLPPLPAGQPQGGRFGLQSGSSIGGGGPGPSMLHQQVVPPAHSGAGGGSNHGSLSSHGRSSGSSVRDLMSQDPNDIWAYVRALEQRFSKMQDEHELRIARLQEDITAMKGQLSQAASYSSEMNNRPY